MFELDSVRTQTAFAFGLQIMLSCTTDSVVVAIGCGVSEAPEMDLERGR